MYKFSFLIFFMLFLYESFSQSLTKKDLRFVYSTIEIFISGQENDNEKTWERNSEFIFCFLKIDSAGTINDVSLFSNDKNHDSTFFYLSRIKPDLFNKWIGEKCKNKTIMIPIYSYSRDGKTPEEVKALSKFYSRIPGAIIEEKDNVIVGSLLTYSTPYRIKEETPRKIKVISEKKQN